MLNAALKSYDDLQNGSTDNRFVLFNVCLKLKVRETALVDTVDLTVGGYSDQKQL